MKLRHVLFNEDPKYKKRKEYAQDESDIDDDWIAEHEESMKAKEVEKAEKKFAKDNEKLVQEGGKPMKDKELQERLSVIEADFKRLNKERGTKRATLKRDRPPAKIEEAIEKLDEKIKIFKLQIEDREAGKEVALGTRYDIYFAQLRTSLTVKIQQ
jgi:DNA topoisomerase-1